MKSKIFTRIILLAVVTVALVTIISSRITISEQEKKMARLEAQKEALLAENERLEHDLASDVTDEYIIRIMRQLGYYFPGEKQFTVTETPSTEEE